MKTLYEKLKVSTGRIKAIKEGNDQIFTERKSEPPGNTSHGFAIKLGIKITTEKCLIIHFRPVTTDEMIIVTRKSKESKLQKGTLISDKLKVTVAKLKAMKKGEIQIFTEKSNSKPGARSQGFAVRCGLKIKTNKCFLITFKPSHLMEAVIVTKL